MAVTLTPADAQAIARYLIRVVPYGVADADDLLRLIAILNPPTTKGDKP